jgi:hypothetical protein
MKIIRNINEINKDFMFGLVCIFRGAFDLIGKILPALGGLVDVLTQGSDKNEPKTPPAKTPDKALELLKKPIKGKKQ